MSDPYSPLAPRRAKSEVEAFLAAASQAPAAARGRLIFALDTTMSRQPTWDLAQHVQGRMFDAAAAVGGLDVQLVYFRGQSECRASRFVDGGQGLGELMSRIGVRGGLTQWRRVLGHARDEAKRAPVGALVLIGDAFEEAVEPVLALAGELALVGVKAFAFREGDDDRAAAAFREIARVTGGAYGVFNSGAAARLAELLRAAAAYAAGGRTALARLAREGGEAHLLLRQMRG